MAISFDSCSEDPQNAYSVLVKGLYLSFLGSCLPALTWVFNLRPPVPEADAVQLELS